MMDALADVITVSFLIRRLAPERICAGTVTTGFGSVHCMHGILPAPAPATEKLLEGIPVQAGTIEGELCTPTGAALLGYFVDDFGPMPPMIIQKSGYGCGKKEFPKANCVRALLGEMVSDGQPQGNILCINCNVDDMTPEEIAFATERIAAAGAAEVYTVPAGMKKGRPGIQITAFCAPDRKEAVLSAFFKHTSTIGVRFFRRDTGWKAGCGSLKLRTGPCTLRKARDLIRHGARRTMTMRLHLPSGKISACGKPERESGHRKYAYESDHSGYCAACRRFKRYC